MNENDLSVYVITALLPLTAFMLIFQVNPYHALVIRGILGAIAALVYAVLGAADVALTEALVGTMLAITLYAVAVRSSLVMRLGVLKDLSIHDRQFEQLLNDLRTILGKHHMRLEVFPYTDMQSLDQALIDKEVHAICSQRSQPQSDFEQDYEDCGSNQQSFHTAIRVQRLYEIMQTELASPGTILTYVKPSSQEKHS